ncbi:cytochrome b5 [Rhizophagus diaphanus]|nr:cytochrome b5 [Rhizophagus diaphanus] [Rhizophagus sp. MUCL 43196]
MSGNKEFTIDELAQHNTKASLYISIKGKVYDVTKFIDEHPGGEEVLLDEAGRDATEAFEDVGHSDEAHGLLKGFEIGVLKEGSQPQTQKPPTHSYPKHPQPESSSSVFNYLFPLGVLVAFIAYKYISG